MNTYSSFFFGGEYLFLISANSLSAPSTAIGLLDRHHHRRPRKRSYRRRRRRRHGVVNMLIATPDPFIRGSNPTPWKRISLVFWEVDTDGG